MESDHHPPSDKPVPYDGKTRVRKVKRNDFYPFKLNVLPDIQFVPIRQWEDAYFHPWPSEHCRATKAQGAVTLDPIYIVEGGMKIPVP